MKRKAIVVFFSALLSFPAYAGWQDILNDFLGGDSTTTSTPSSSSQAANKPTTADMNRAILDALVVGIKKAIAVLGKQNGFLSDAEVRIPMPRDLEKIETLARKLGQDKYADRFIASMNHAAEQAVPKTTQIFLDSIKSMNVHDAQSILQGGDNAATQYFRKNTSSQIEQVIKPIVTKAMNDVGVTSHYKKLISKVDFLDSYIDPDTLDIDSYVTKQAVNGLFIKLEEEERLIRKDPAARSSELLKQVFGYFQS